MRGFPDIESREPMKAQFYEGKLWKDELENVLMPMLEKYEVVVVEDSDNLLKWGLPVSENFHQEHVDDDAH
jgi:hypothetical protein